MEKKINITQLLGRSWEIFKSNAGRFIGIIVIMMIFSAVPEALVRLAPENQLYAFFISVIFLVPQIILSMGVIKYTLDVIDGQNPGLSVLFSQYRYFFRFFGASFLFNIIAVTGYLLLIVPGIILSIRLQFFSYLIIDRDSKAVDSLKESWNRTSGITMDLFCLALVTVGINLLGFIALFAGLLVSVPVTMILIGLLFRELTADTAIQSQSIKEQAA